MTRGAWPLALAGAVSIACRNSSFAELEIDRVRQDPSVVFAAARDGLLLEGVRIVDGFAFSSVRLRISAESTETRRAEAPARAEERAIRQLLLWRLAPQVAADLEPEGLQRAATDSALRCLEGSFDFSGIVTVHSETKDEVLTLVCALPASRLEPITMDRAGLIECLERAVKEGTASPVDGLVLDELRPSGDPADGSSGRGLRSTLLRAHGPGIELALSGRWVDSQGRICPPAVAGWTAPAARAVSMEGSTSGALEPLRDEALRGLSIDDLLGFLATRIHDPSVREAVVSRLEAAGFARSAEHLRRAPAVLRAFVDRPGDALDRSVRAALFASPVVTTMLLSDGEPGAAWGPPPPGLDAAKSAFDEAKPESVARSVELLVEGMGSTPNADALSLLSAALIDRDEARIAEPLARAAFLATPTHPFAGVNALRAARILSDRERVRRLLPLVRESARLDAWGRRELDAIAAWLDPPALPPEKPSNPPSAAPAGPDVAPAAPPPAASPQTPAPSAPEAA